MIETIKIGRLRWLNIKDPSEEDFKFLENQFHFHPLDLEDCQQFNQRSKIDIYDDYYFVVLLFPVFDRQNRFIKSREVKIFWGEDYLITVGKSHYVVDKVFEESLQQEERGEDFEVGTSDALLYLILEKIMNETIYLIRKVGLELELINRELLGKNPHSIIERLSITRKNIILLNTLLKPQLRVFNKFESGAVRGFADNMEDYWGNILDYYQKMWDMTEDYQELIEGLSKTFDSLQAHKINDIMKVLTFFSTILLPLTFITGLYGMNVGLPLQNDPHSFFIVLIAMVIIVVVMLLYFKRKRWI